MQLIKVNEIFHSIQGESSYAGCPCVFVRLTGCNLRCTYCDTPYAYEEGENLTISEILEKVGSYGCRLVEITGGEPLLQAPTPGLIKALLERGHQVLLETNGSRDTGEVDKRCVKIIDVKCPSSGEHKTCNRENLLRLTDRDELKFVIGSRRDYEYAKQVLRDLPPKTDRKTAIHFSPANGRISPRVLAEWIITDHLDVRLHLQLHKIIWPDEQRGF